MFTEARQLRNQNLIRDCWTMDGNLFVRDMHARIQVFSDIMAFSKWKEHLMVFPPQTYSEILNKPNILNIILLKGIVNVKLFIRKNGNNIF